MPLLILLLLLAFVVLVILAAIRKIRLWWPAGIAVAGLIFIAFASGEEEVASILFGIAGFIAAITTAAIVMSALRAPLSNLLEETIGEGPAKVGIIFAKLIVYFAGLKAGASIFREAAGVSQEMLIHAFSAAVGAPADALETILETIKAPWLILFGVLTIVGYLIYQRIQGDHHTDSMDAGSEPEQQKES